MKVLILGGTGAMGVPLVDILSATNEVYVTSRSARTSDNPAVHYVVGNAMHKDFLSTILTQYRWDAVVDFMVRKTAQLKELLPLFLASTSQYVFISSARVYAESNGLITESTPRLLDCSTDEEFLKTNEYSLAKAREEDLLLNSGSKNFTIIRPSITYNDYRLQLGVMEKEDFIYRALHGHKIVFSEDLKDKVTTMTHGSDVAKGIASIIGHSGALGEIFHITSPKSLTWGEVLAIYQDVLEEYLGHPVEIVWTSKTTNFGLENQLYRIRYCRYFNRSFDCSKIGQFVDVEGFVTPEMGLRKCLTNFLAQPRYSRFNWSLQGINDRVTGEYYPITSIPRFADKLWYLVNRFKLTLLHKLLKLIVRIK